MITHNIWEKNQKKKKNQKKISISNWKKKPHLELCNKVSDKIPFYAVVS